MWEEICRFVFLSVHEWMSVTELVRGLLVLTRPSLCEDRRLLMNSQKPFCLGITWNKVLKKNRLVVGLTHFRFFILSFVQSCHSSLILVYKSETSQRRQLWIHRKLTWNSEEFWSAYRQTLTISLKKKKTLVQRCRCPRVLPLNSAREE